MIHHVGSHLAKLSKLQDRVSPARLYYSLKRQLHHVYLKQGFSAFKWRIDCQNSGDR